MAPSRSVPSPASGGFGLNRRLRRWLVSELQGLRPVIEASAAGCGADMMEGMAPVVARLAGR